MQPRTTRRPLVTALVLTLVALAGCSDGAPSSSDSSQDGRRGGELRVVAYSEFGGFDPVRVTYAAAGLERAAAVMDTLLFYDERSGEVSPKLAESMTSDEGRVWTLTLRDGVEFTDGTPLDGEAVKFNVERHMAPDSGSIGQTFLADVQSIEVVDPLTVRFTLSEPNGSFPVTLTGYSPVGLIGSPKALADPEEFNANPVGAGPFVLDQWVRDSELRLTRNEDHWDAERPYVDRLVFPVIPDEDGRSNSLIAGDADIALTNASTWRQLEEAGDVTVYNRDLPGGGYILPNQRRGPGRSLAVRQAIQMAFNGEESAKIFFGDTSEVWNGDVSCLPYGDASPYCTPGMKPEHDLGRAQQLVAEYVADGGDPRAELSFLLSQSNQATYMQSVLDSIGLEVELNPLDGPTLAGVGVSGEFDLLFNQITTPYPSYWNRLYSASATHWPVEPSAEMDAALLAARNGETVEQRAEAWRRVEELIAEDGTVTFVNAYMAAMAISDRVHFEQGTTDYWGSTMLYFDSASVNG